MRPEQETALEALQMIRGGWPDVLDDIFNDSNGDPIRFKRVTGYSIEELKTNRDKRNERIDAAIAWVKSQS